MKQVLVLDHDNETAHFLCFLLRLGGFEATRTRCGEETVNWAASRDRLHRPFDLVLISRPLPSPPLASLVAEIRSRASRVPVLVLDRPETSPLFPPSGVRICHPSEVMSAVRQMLGSGADAPVDEENERGKEMK